MTWVPLPSDLLQPHFSRGCAGHHQGHAHYGMLHSHNPPGGGLLMMKVRLGAEGEMVLGSACRGLGDDRWHFHDIDLSSFLHFLSHPISDEQCTANVLQIAVPSYTLSLKCLGEMQS